METLWSAWTEKQGPYLYMQNTSLWGEWANLSNWILSTGPTLVPCIRKKLQELNVGPSRSMGFKFQYSYDKLQMKIEKTKMKPAEILFIQDSIGRKHSRDGKEVQETVSALSDSKISPHRIPHMNVFTCHVTQRINTTENRRLYAFKQAGTQLVPVQLTTREAVLKFKFSTKNNGVSVYMR